MSVERRWEGTLGGMEPLGSRLALTLRLAVVVGGLGVAALVALRADAAPAPSPARTWLLEPLVEGRGIEGYSSRVSSRAG